MSIADGIISVCVFILFIAFIWLAYQRQNGHINHEEPEPTLRRQLNTCEHRLAAALQSVEVWKTVTERQKEIISDMARVLEDDE